MHAWKSARLVTIRKSDLVDSMGVVVISNRRMCRLEIVCATDEGRRLRAGAGRLRVPKWETAVPGVKGSRVDGLRWSATAVVRGGGVKADWDAKPEDAGPAPS